MQTAKVIGIAAAGCVLVVGIAFVAIVLALGSCFDEPEQVTVTIDSPLTVAAGSRFELVATLENGAGSPKTLVDIDVADEYLAGMAIESTDPPAAASEHIPVDDTVSHSFDLPIPAHGSLQVRFALYAAHAGDFAGDFDFCVDSEVRCVSRRVRTIVTR